MPIPAPSDGQPDATEVTTYLGDSGGSWDEEAVQAALDAEIVDQANRVRFPLNDDGEPTYTAALREALCRRVAHNLAVRALPLGVQATVTEMAAMTTYVGGTDAEVKRLEAPYRKRVVA